MAKNLGCKNCNEWCLFFVNFQALEGAFLEQDDTEYWQDLCKQQALEPLEWYSPLQRCRHEQQRMLRQGSTTAQTCYMNLSNANGLESQHVGKTNDICGDDPHEKEATTHSPTHGGNIICRDTVQSQTLVWGKIIVCTLHCTAAKKTLVK